MKIWCHPTPRMCVCVYLLRARKNISTSGFQVIKGRHTEEQYFYPKQNYTITKFCLIGFYGISTFVGYLMPNLFLYNKQFYFKQFSLA